MGFRITALTLLLLFQTSPQRAPNTGIVTGLLRTKAGPLENVRIAVTPAGSGGQADLAVLESLGLTDKAGRYRLEGVAAGRYHLVIGRVEAPFFHPGVPDVERATTISVFAGQVTEVPEIQFGGGSIAGRVLDGRTGQPLQVALLTLCCDWVIAPQNLANTLTSVVFVSSSAIRASVNDDGTFLFPSVPPGNYSLQVADPRFVASARTLTVGSGEALTGVEIRVTSGVDVRGRIRDRHERPVGGVQVSLKPDRNNAVFELFDIKLAPDGYPISFSSSSFLPTSRSSRQMEAVRAAISSSKPRTASVAEDGTFSLRGVLPGKYSLEMQAAGQMTFGREIDVGASESLNVSMDLPSTQLFGRIVVENGSSLPPVSGSVRMVSADPNQRMLFGFPDRDGRFTILVTPGEYRFFTDLLSVDRDIVSVSDGSADLRRQPLVFDGRPIEVRIAIAR